MSRHLHAKTTPSRKPLDVPGAPKTARRLILRILQFNGSVNSRRRSGSTLTGHSHTAWARSNAVGLSASRVHRPSGSDTPKSRVLGGDVPNWELPPKLVGDWIELLSDWLASSYARRDLVHVKREIQIVNGDPAARIPGR